MTSTKVASALRTLPGCGPCLAENVINTLLLLNLARFDMGVLGPGAIKALAYLQGHDVTNDTGQSKGLWLDQADPARRPGGQLPLGGHAVRPWGVVAPAGRPSRRARVPVPVPSGPAQIGVRVGVSELPPSGRIRMRGWTLTAEAPSAKSQAAPRNSTCRAGRTSPSPGSTSIRGHCSRQSSVGYCCWLLLLTTRERRCLADAW